MGTHVILRAYKARSVLFCIRKPRQWRLRGEKQRIARKRQKIAWLSGNSQIATVLISDQFTFPILWIVLVLHPRPRNWHRCRGAVPSVLLPQEYPEPSFNSSIFSFSPRCHGTMKRTSQNLSSGVPGIAWLKFYYQMRDFALAFLILLEPWIRSLIKVTTS